MASEYPAEFLAKLKAVAATRAKRVIDHILAHGHITTEELKSQYGYDHPPRAARNVREQGIPLETFRVARADGRKIAAYRFADPSTIRGAAHAGRRVFSKAFKNALVARDGARCAICLTQYDERYLQIDHRVPYEVAGDKPGEPNRKDYFLICGSCNRAKSWSCEHCQNWIKLKRKGICRSCYWASPTSYTHIATVPMRRLDLTWNDKEVVEYDKLAKKAHEENAELPEFVKVVLRKNLEAGFS